MRHNLVVVTRPEPDDGPLSSALRRNGLEPVVAPAFTFLDVEQAPSPATVNGYPWVVWTSAAAVDAVSPLPSESTSHAAVGGATADALREHEIEPVVVGDAGSAALAETLVGALAPGTRLLYPRSAQADASFAQRLRSFGIEVDDPVVYRIGPADPAAVRSAMYLKPCAVAFASPSAVDGFAGALGGADLLADVILSSIGATTTAALKAALREPDVVAEAPSFDALAEATATAIGRAR